MTAKPPPLRRLKPRKLSKAERVKRALHQRVQHERSQAQATAREAHLRFLMGLPRRAFSDGTSIRGEP
jgi:hypothetical protein